MVFEVLNWEFSFNMITSLVIIFIGIFIFLASFFRRHHTWRWKVVYFIALLVGLSAFFHHAYDSSFRFWFADIWAGILAIWAAQFAILHDYYRNDQGTIKKSSFIAGIVMFAIMIVMGVLGIFSADLDVFIDKLIWYDLGAALLVINSVLMLGLLAFKYKTFSRKEKVALNCFIGILLLGFLLKVVGSLWFNPEGMIHAVWHITVGLGFFVLWMFNYIRLKRKN